MLTGVLHKSRASLTNITSLWHSTQLRYKTPMMKRTINNQQEAYLRYNEGEEHFNFTFRYTDESIRLDREFNLIRRVQEPISVFTKRIEANVEKFVTKKKTSQARKQQNKKNAQEGGATSVDETPVEEVQESNEKKVVLLKDNVQVDEEQICQTLIDENSVLNLDVYGNSYTVKINMPWIQSIALPSSILAGFPTYPCKLEWLHCDKTQSLFHWYRQAPKNKWDKVGEGFFYLPTSEDIGCKLKIVCTPVNNRMTGPVVEVESPVAVEAGPGKCPFDYRHEFTKEKLEGKSFRVVSYNLLADLYTETDYTKTVLFPYCPEYALSMDYRKQLILKELIGYNADIICLQEVDNKIFKNDLEPTLSSLNFEGLFNSKGDTREGVSTFYNKDRFEKLGYESLLVSQNVANVEEFKKVFDKVQSEEAKQRFLDRNTTVQSTILRSKENPKEILVLGNTHLYFHPNADYIRLLQGYFVLQYMIQTIEKAKKEYPEDYVSFMLCGDFNSVPECGIYQLMTEKYVPEDCIDWSSCPTEPVGSISLSNNLNISSACGTPEYTNFTVEFAACLDYIFYQTDRLKVSQVIPFPSKEELTTHSAIPSVVFPSDHVSLCADLTWTS